MKDKQKILVVGDVMLDSYMGGEAVRISPEAPVPVLRSKSDEHRPGGAANLAANIAAMGGDVTIMRIVGPDAVSGNLTKILSQSSLQQLNLFDSEASTTHKIRIVAGGQQVVRLDRDYAPDLRIQAILLDEFEKHIGNYDYVVFSDYAKGTLDNLPRFIEIAKKSGVKMLADPKRKDPNFYRGVDVIKPNNGEFVDLFGSYRTESEFSLKALSNINVYEFQHIVTTRGSKGIFLANSDGSYSEFPAHAMEVYDVSGAGDTVLAALTVELAKGNSINKAVEVARVAAGIAVSKRGTYVVSESEIKIEMERLDSVNGKIVSVAEIEKIADSCRKTGSRVIFTNGCFDILHPGHTRLLREAKKTGDVLIIGVNSDQSVRQLKGRSRPVNTFLDRAEVLSALFMVDYIVEFDELTPLNLIKKILPNTLVKGGDYPIDQIVGSDFVKNYGGDVFALSFHAGFSTSNIISDIEKGTLDNDRE